MSIKLYFVFGGYDNGINPNSTDAANVGIGDDTVSGAMDTSMATLANGVTDPAFDQTATNFLILPGAITIDAPRHTFYVADLTNDGETGTDNSEILSGSTTTGAITSTIYTIPLTTNEINLGYIGTIGDVKDDAATQTIYFTQDVIDDNYHPDAAQTGIYKISESGGAATEIVSGVTSPTVLALDLADNLVFFTDSTGQNPDGGTVSNADGSAITPVNDLDVANLTTGKVTVLLSEPYAPDPVYGTTGYGGKDLDGIAINAATHTLYYTTSNPITAANSGTDGIFSASYSVTGSGSTAAATIGASTTLYSGANSFDPTTISLDVADGVFYVAGGVPSSIPRQ